MKKLYVTLKVKFRAFGITFGTLERFWDFDMPAPMPNQHILRFDERGVFLSLEVRE